MAEFLSPAWIAELDAAARRAAVPSGLGRLTVEQVVREGPGGEVRYHLEIADGYVRVHEGPAQEPDLRLLADYATAVAIHRGEVNAQEALATGGCRLEGSLQGLRGREAALRELDDIFAAVRATTTYA